MRITRVALATPPCLGGGARSALIDASRRPGRSSSPSLHDRGGGRILIAVVVNLTGGGHRNTFFNGKYFVQAFPQVLSGLWLNIRILLVVVLGVAVQTLLAAARTSVACVLPGSVSAAAYTDILSEASFPGGPLPDRLRYPRSIRRRVSRPLFWAPLRWC